MLIDAIFAILLLLTWGLIFFEKRGKQSKGDLISIYGLGHLLQRLFAFLKFFSVSKNYIFRILKPLYRILFISLLTYQSCCWCACAESKLEFILPWGAVCLKIMGIGENDGFFHAETTVNLKFEFEIWGLLQFLTRQFQKELLFD